MWGEGVSPVEAIQYCGGGSCSTAGDSISTCGGIASVLWRDSISTVEAVQYCGGSISTVETIQYMWGIASVLWRLFSTCGGIASVLWRLFSTAELSF